MNKENKALNIAFKILTYVLVAAFAAFITNILVMRRDRGKLEQLEAIIDYYYIEDYDKTAVEDSAAAAMVDALGNPWSYYIPAKDYAAHVERQENAYVGVGITISPMEDGEGLVIEKVEPGSGAEEAGVKPGDILIRVDGQGNETLTVDLAKTLSQGDEGTYVGLTVLRDGQEKTFRVERRRIRTIVATGQLLSGNVGYIKINNFNDRCAEETLKLIEELQSRGATKLLFDVRFNPGGYKAEMVKVLDHLLPEGDLFRSVDYAGREEVDTSDAACLDIPMAVLVNGDSYSAAEFFAAALQEYEWATVVGQPTTGKSHFQITLGLRDGSAVNLSVGKYLTPKGVSLTDVGGLQPDKIVELNDEQYLKTYYGEVALEEDPQILAALEVLKTA